MIFEKNIFQYKVIILKISLVESLLSGNTFLVAMPTHLWHFLTIGDFFQRFDEFFSRPQFFICQRGRI
jgi:hypothetical protein